MTLGKPIALLAALAMLAGCGSKEEPQAVVEQETTTVVSEAESTVAKAATTATDVADDALAAVEESDGSFDEQAVAREGSLRMAQEEKPAAPARFKEGQHYQRFRPAKMTVGDGEVIEVAEVFWYGCGHCYNLEPVMNRWAQDLPEDVKLVKLPVAWPQAEKHVKVFYTIEALAGMGVIEDVNEVNMAIFDAIHVNGARMVRDEEIFQLVKRFGADKESFDKAWNSFEVNTRSNQAKTLTRAYGIQSVPAVVVNGKYITSEVAAGGKQELLAVIDELVASER